MAVDPVEEIMAIAMDRSNYDCDEEKGNKIIGEKLIEIAGVLGISMEDLLGVRETLEEKYWREGPQKSMKKSITQRELNKLAFFVNYERATTENHMGVKLLGT